MESLLEGKALPHTLIPLGVILFDSRFKTLSVTLVFNTLVARA